MVTTISFSSNFSYDCSDKSFITSSAVAHSVRGCSKRSLRIIPSQSTREEFEVSFILARNVSEFENDLNPEYNEIFADDICATNKERKLINCIALQETRSNFNGVSFNCSYSWSMTDS